MANDRYLTNRDPGDETPDRDDYFLPGEQEEYAYPVTAQDIIAEGDGTIVLHADAKRFKVGRLVVTEDLTLYRLSYYNLSRGEIEGVLQG